MHRVHYGEPRSAPASRPSRASRWRRPRRLLAFLARVPGLRELSERDGRAEGGPVHAVFARRVRLRALPPPKRVEIPSDQGYRCESVLGGSHVESTMTAPRGSNAVTRAARARTDPRARTGRRRVDPLLPRRRPALPSDRRWPTRPRRRPHHCRRSTVPATGHRRITTTSRPCPRVSRPGGTLAVRCRSVRGSASSTAALAGGRGRLGEPVRPCVFVRCKRACGDGSRRISCATPRDRARARGRAADVVQHHQLGHGGLGVTSQDRDRARCRRCRRSVSPPRPPNRTCTFPRIRLSTGHAMADRGAGSCSRGLRSSGGSCCSGGRPRRGDAVAAIGRPSCTDGQPRTSRPASVTCSTWSATPRRCWSRGRG